MHFLNSYCLCSKLDYGSKDDSYKVPLFRGSQKSLHIKNSFRESYKGNSWSIAIISSELVRLITSATKSKKSSSCSRHRIVGGVIAVLNEKSPIIIKFNKKFPAQITLIIIAASS